MNTKPARRDRISGCLKALVINLIGMGRKQASPRGRFGIWRRPRSFAQLSNRTPRSADSGGRLGMLGRGGREPPHQIPNTPPWTNLPFSPARMEESLKRRRCSGGGHLGQSKVPIRLQVSSELAVLPTDDSGHISICSEELTNSQG